MPVELIQLDLPAPQLLFETISTPANDGILDEQPTDEGAVWRFGISQQSFERLVSWGWDAAIIGAYFYTFIPTNVGCVVYVTNEASGEKIWLVDPDDL